MKRQIANISTERLRSRLNTKQYWYGIVPFPSEQPIVDNANIDSQDLGRKGLHLNARGVGKFAINLINKMRSF